MNRENAIRNRNRADILNEEWEVGAVQGRYSYDGHWYAILEHFPAALFDSTGYVLFVTESAYRNSPQLRIRKQISVPKRISSMPDYVRMADSTSVAPADEHTISIPDLDIHSDSVTEGQQRLVAHLQRERNRTIIKKKKKAAISLDCEVCGFSFSELYGSAAKNYCEVHHLLPLSEVEDKRQTRLEDLAILCANCHRVVHLHNPPYTLEQVREMLAKQLLKRTHR